MSEYKCDHCRDTGWCTAKRLEDGTELKVFCYCHPLVRKRKVKPLDGECALERLVKKKKGVYEVKE